MQITSSPAAPSTIFQYLAPGDRFVPEPGSSKVGVKFPILPGVTYPWNATGTVNAADAGTLSWDELPSQGEPSQLRAHVGLHNLGNGRMQVTFTPTGFNNVQLPSVEQPMDITEQTPTHLELRGGLGAYASLDFQPARPGDASPVPLGTKDVFKGVMSIRIGAGGGFGPTLTMEKTGSVFTPGS